MDIKRAFKGFAAAALLAAGFAGNAPADDAKTVKIGVAPGPYGQLVKLAIQPGLEKKGYKVEIVQFQDWVQPNLALGNGDVDVNVFQHSLYLAKFSADHGLKLSPVISIPTAELGFYSQKAKSLSDLKKDDEVTLASDPTNLARSLTFLQKAGLIKLKGDVDPTKSTIHDIAENPKGLRFTPTEAAQLPRTLDGVAASVVPGNYAIAAGLKLADALVLETLDEPHKNIVAARTADLDKAFVADIKSVVGSKEFHAVVADPKNGFSAFQLPEWYVKKWGAVK
jgi:D-methionine transport system substrate-binding protein